MIRQFTSREDCLSCRGCCSFFDASSCWTPVFLEEEALELKKRGLLKKTPLEFKVPLVSWPSGSNNFICSFFDAPSSQCRIYSYRPFECRLYPFLINRSQKKVFLSADLNCPVVKRSCNTKEFKDYADYLARLLNSTPYLKILTSNPQVVREYGNVIDIAQLNIP